MSSKASQANIFKRIGDFFSTYIEEARKVTWPSRPEIVRVTIMVIIVTIISAIIIFVLNRIFDISLTRFIELNG
ncbi:preprotein translocase subunit SecE [Candidatus Saccharibacteria bacterium]|nr:preprotein translocase subunit SecE [Candidatus Saccharibacteria bacterium]MCB9834884.1 preprotein translocase subunit SecE [Candidatus Nomurabacteria bacterium]